MSDFRDELDRLARGISEENDTLDHVRTRADRHRRTRRMTAGVVALAIASASVGLALAAFRPGDQLRPADSSDSGQPHIWPEGTDQDADEVQREVDEGEGTWRRDDPAQVARAFAVEELQWESVDIETRTIDPLTVAISNPSVAEAAGATSEIETTLFLERWRGREDGILIVTHTKNEMFQIIEPKPGWPAPPGGKVNYAGTLSSVAKELRLSLSLSSSTATSLSSEHARSVDNTELVFGEFKGETVRDMFFFLQPAGEKKFPFEGPPGEMPRLAVTALALAPPEEAPIPAPAHTSGPSPEVVPAGSGGPSLYIDNNSGVQGLENSVNALLEGPFMVTGSSGQPLNHKQGKGETHLRFIAGSEDLALAIRDKWFPGAPISEGAPPGINLGGPPIPRGPDGEIDEKDFEEFMERAASGDIPPNPPDVTVFLGPDYTSYPIVEGIEMHRFLGDFADARTAGQGAEAFLSPEAAAQYANHDNGLQLYSYWPEDEEFGLNSLKPRDGGTYEATLDVDPQDSPLPTVVIFETVTVERRPGGGFWITYAETDP